MKTLALVSSIALLAMTSATAFAEPTSTVAGVDNQIAPDYSKAQEAFTAANRPSLPPFNRTPLPTTYQPRSESAPSRSHFAGGFDLSLGAPSGAEVGFVFQPWTHMVRGEFGLTHNGLSFGGMAAATFTPIKFPIMPVLQVEAGFFPEASLPGFIATGKTMPTIGYDWVSMGPGLEFGSRDSVVFFIHPALTYIHLTTGNFQSVIDSNVGNGAGNLQTGNPFVNGWFMPTGRIGFSVLF